MNINKWTLNILSILLLVSYMPLEYSMQQEQNRGRFATLIRSNAFKNSLLIGGGCVAGFLAARAMLKDSDKVTQLSLNENGAKLGIDFLRNVQNAAFAIAIGSLPIFTVMTNTVSHWMIIKYLETKFGDLFSNNNPIEYPNENDVYMNALDSAPQDIKDLCTLLDLKGSYSNINFGGRTVALNNLLPLGYILDGPPGCGKTEIAKAMSQKYGFGFHVIRHTDIASNFVNSTSLKLKKRFDTIRSTTPVNGVSIVFIDEIDTLAPKRTSNENGNDSVIQEDNKVVNILLQEIQGFSQSNKKIIVLGATNRIDVIDNAIISRLTKIPMRLPTKNQRLKAIKQQSLKILGTRFTNDLSKWLARETEKFSYRDLHGLLSTFARKTVTTKYDHPVDLLAQCIMPRMV